MLVSKRKLVILAWESVGLTCFWREPRVANRGTAVFGTFSCWVRFFDFTSPKVVAGSKPPEFYLNKTLMSLPSKLPNLSFT